MAGGAADRVVFRGPADGRQELRDHEPVRRLLDVLAIGPPTEIVRPLDLRIRALEPGHVLPEKLRGLGIGHRLRVQFRVGGVEAFDVRFEHGRLQDPPFRGLGASAQGDQQQDPEDAKRAPRTGIRVDFVLRPKVQRRCWSQHQSSPLSAPKRQTSPEYWAVARAACRPQTLEFWRIRLLSCEIRNFNDLRARQSLAVSSDRAAQPPQIVAAFEEGDHAAFGALVGQIEHQSCQIREILVLQLKAAQGVAVPRIKAGGDQHQFGLELSSCVQEIVGERAEDLRTSRPRGERAIHGRAQAAAIPGLSRRRCLDTTAIDAC